MTTTPKTGGRKQLWFIGVALLAASLFLWRSCPPPPPPVARNDCQQDHLVIRLPDRDSVVGTDLPLLGPIADLPEFHDCQRLLVAGGTPGAVSAAAPDGMAYGPLVAIWAAYKLDRASFPGDGEDAVPVAVIYNFDSTHAYTPLGIEPGFSCLYLWNDGSWHALIDPLGNDKSATSQCVAPRRLDDAMRRESGRFDVIPATLRADLGPADIPPVARWDWDSANGQQYIDIQCGEEWCQVGAQGLSPTPPALGSSLTVAEVMALPDIRDRSTGTDERSIIRAFAVKGWYDEQRLDLPGNTLMAAPRLTELVGTAFPHPTLELANFENHEWTTVAYLRVPDQYDGVVPLRAGISRLQMCEGTADECGAPAVKSCSAKDQDAGDPWWGRTISEAGDTSAVGCVRRRDHQGQAVPAAAARWNWNELDAKTWAACRGGCCVMN